MRKGARFTLEQLSAMPSAVQSQVAAALQPHSKPVLATFKAPDGTTAPITPRRKGRRVERTRNGGAWTEAMYWQALRSGLRRLFRFWKPSQAALRSARVAYPGKRGAKWAYLCADCNRLFRRKGVQIDHIEPCGELTDLAHLADFLRRLTPEAPAAYRVRCLKCHQAKTSRERSLTGKHQ